MRGLFRRVNLGFGPGVDPIVDLSHVSYPLSPIHALLSSIKAHCCEDKAIIIGMSHCCEDEAIII